MATRGFTRILSGIALASAAAIGMAFLTPAAASAERVVLPPPLSVSVSGNNITFTIKNPNPRLSLINCTPAIVDIRNLPAVISDPASLLDPGVLVYPQVTNIGDLFGVLPQRELTKTVTDIPTGVYAVVGACVFIPSLIPPITTLPAISLPEVVVVGGFFEGLGTGSVSGSLEGLGFESVNDLIEAWERISAGSSDSGSGNGSAVNTGSNSESLGTNLGSFDFQGGSGIDVVVPTS